MGNIAFTFHYRQRGHAAIGSVSTQVLMAAHGRRRNFHHDRSQYGFQLRDVMALRSGDDERQRDTTSVDQKMTLAAISPPRSVNAMNKKLINMRRAKSSNCSV